MLFEDVFIRFQSMYPEGRWELANIPSPTGGKPVEVRTKQKEDLP